MKRFFLWFSILATTMVFGLAASGVRAQDNTKEEITLEDVEKTSIGFNV